MNSIPLVSIIIPCYNSEKFIYKTLETVANQTYKNIEVIIVDDGSKDNTVDISKNILENKKVRYKIICQSNSGVSVARNNGIKNSNGEFIFFLDSDDFIDELCIETVVKKLVKDDLDIIWFGYNYIDEYGNYTMKYEENYNYSIVESGKDALIKQLNHNISICNINIVYKRDIILKNNIKFYEKCYYGEDQEFILKSIFHANKVGCIDKVMAYYFQRSNSATHNFNLKRFTGLGAAKRIEKYIKNLTNDKIIINLLNNKIALEILQIYHNYVKCEKVSKQYYEHIFSKLKIKYKKELINYKISSKKDIKYKFLSNIFLINPNLYKQLLLYKQGKNNVRK